MNDLKLSQVVKQNAFRAVLTSVCFKVWHDTDFALTINNNIQHYVKDCYGLTRDWTENDIKAFYSEYINRLKTDDNFCYSELIKEKQTYCPQPKSVKEFLFKNELPFTIIQQFQNACIA